MRAYPKLGSVFGIPQSFTLETSHKMLPLLRGASKRAAGPAGNWGGGKQTRNMTVWTDLVCGGSGNGVGIGHGLML